MAGSGGRKPMAERELMQHVKTNVVVMTACRGGVAERLLAASANQLALAEWRNGNNIWRSGAVRFVAAWRAGMAERNQ